MGTCIACGEPIAEGRQLCAACSGVVGSEDDKATKADPPGASDSEGGDQPSGQPSGMEGRLLGGSYRLGARVGRGGMGEVYEAEHLRLGSRVAVKILRDQALSNTDNIQRFHREALAASAVGHENIVKVTDFDVDSGGTPYLVMEFLEGESLRERLDRESTLGLDEAVAITGQILDALQAAHDQSIVHRDLKPTNIQLVTRFGRTDFVKVLDFGVSKILGAEVLLTGEGNVVGTPVYMSPEQIQAKSDVDHRSDIYTVGVLLYEMLVGRRPHSGHRYESVIHNVVHEPSPSAREAVPDLPRRLSDAMERALDKDPQRRFGSCREMAVAIGWEPTDSGWPTRGGGSGVRTDGSPGPGGVGHGRLRWVAGVMVVAALLAGVGYLALRPSAASLVLLSGRPTGSSASPTAPPPGQPSDDALVAVLRFRNLSGDADVDWLGTGIAATVAADLAQIRRIQVLDRSRVDQVILTMSAADRGDPLRVGRALGAAWVLSGSYQRLGDRIRMTARFHGVRTRRALPPLRLQGPLNQVFALQDRIVQRMANVLKVALDRSDRERLARGTTRSLKAYKALALATTACQRSLWKACFGGLNEAIRLDPQYAWAYVQRGMQRYYRYGYGRFDRRNLAAAIVDFTTAAKHKPELEPYRAVSAVIHLLLGNYSTAEALVKRLTIEHPKSPRVIMFTGHVYSGSVFSALLLDEVARGMRNYRRYLALRPLDSWIRVNMCEKALAAGDFRRALDLTRAISRHLAEQRRAHLRDIHPPVHKVLEGLALAGLGRPGPAAAALRDGIVQLRQAQQVFAVELYRWLAHHALARVSKLRGDWKQARDQAARAAELEKHLVTGSVVVRPYHPMLDLMLLVDRPRALRLIKSAKGADRDPLAWLYRSTVHLLDGRFARCKAAAKRAWNLAQGAPEVLPYVKRRIERCQQKRALSTILSP